MGDWAIGSGQCPVEAAGAVTASSLMTILATPGGANTVGAWTQLIAATSIEAVGFWLFARCSVGGDFLINIAIGAAASEVTVVANLSVHNGNATASRIIPIWIPLAIPRGSRVAAQQQNDGVDDLYCQLILMGKTATHALGYSRCTTYGANTADSGGTAVDPGTGANTKVITNISTSTTNPIKALFISIGNQIDTSRSDANFLMDIVVGAAASEKVLIPNIPFYSDDISDYFTPCILGPFLVEVPSGTRLGVNVQCDITTTNRLFDVIIYGLD